MEICKNTTDLKNAILHLEEMKFDQEAVLKVQFFQMYENSKPINIIKHTLSDIVNSPEIKSDLSSIVLGKASGYLAEKLVTLNSNNPFTKITGLVVEMLVSKNVIENASEIKTFGGKIMDKLLK